LVTYDEGVTTTLLNDAATIGIDTPLLLYNFDPNESWLQIWKFSLGLYEGFIILNCKLKRAGLWFEIKMFENLSKFYVKAQVKAEFKFELLEGSCKIADEQTEVWFEEVNW